MQYAGCLLPPANEVCEGYVFTGVCLSRAGVCLNACWDTHPPDRYPLGRYTPQAGTPHLGRYTPWQVHPLGQCMLGYSQQVGGTHPSGMHSCFNLLKITNNLINLDIIKIIQFCLKIYDL